MPLPPGQGNAQFEARNIVGLTMTEPEFLLEPGETGVRLDGATDVVFDRPIFGARPEATNRVAFSNLPPGIKPAGLPSNGTVAAGVAPIERGSAHSADQAMPQEVPQAVPRAVVAEVKRKVPVWIATSLSVVLAAVGNKLMRWLGFTQ